MRLKHDEPTAIIRMEWVGANLLALWSGDHGRNIFIGWQTSEDTTILEVSDLLEAVERWDKKLKELLTSV